MSDISGYTFQSSIKYLADSIVKAAEILSERKPDIVVVAVESKQRPTDEVQVSLRANDVPPEEIKAAVNKAVQWERYSNESE